MTIETLDFIQVYIVYRMIVSCLVSSRTTIGMQSSSIDCCLFFLLSIVL
jgi:hypothetical protein